MMNSPVMKIVAHISWVVTALASIGIGLAWMDINVMSFVPGGMTGSLMGPMQVIVGLCGVASLIMFIMMCSANGCGCNCK